MIKVIKVILKIILLFLFLLSFYFFLSPRAFNARKNVKNSKLVEIGMDKRRMIEIMGKPKDVYPSYLNQEETIYYYEPPFLASDGIEIFVLENTVTNIILSR